MLSMKSKYALRAALRLAVTYGSGPVPIADLSDSERIPRKFLEQILLELKRHGILASAMGRGGGYRLRIPPEQVTFGQIIRIFDGPLAPVRCASLTAYEPCPDCGPEQTCAVRPVMKEARDALAAILDKVTLTEALRRQREASSGANGAGMFYI
jgi:Rrf2 family protein